MKTKKAYQTMQIDRIAAIAASSVLTGSLTTTQIKVNTVEVEDFDTGFNIGEEHNDFQDLSFD